jgi:hypothetical protein
MKKGLPKFVMLSDPNEKLEGRQLILRTEYPRYIFEINRPDDPEQQEFDVQGNKVWITVNKDLNSAGPPPDTYLKEAVRWYVFSHIGSSVQSFLTKLSARADSETYEPGSLKQLFTWMNGAQVAQDCFTKTKAWFYQRLNGNKVNDKTAEFTPEQKRKLAEYFKQRAAELLHTADQLEREADL